MLDLEQRALIVWVKNNAAVLSFLKASGKVFVLLLFLEVLGWGRIYGLWDILRTQRFHIGL